MVKLNNISSSIMSNPLVGVIAAIFLLLIVLAVVRMFQPDFSMGAKLEGHFGTLDGKINLEAFEVDGATVPADEDASMLDQIPGMDADDENESFDNELPGIPSMPAFN